METKLNIKQFSTTIKFLFTNKLIVTLDTCPRGRYKINFLLFQRNFVLILENMNVE